MTVARKQQISLEDTPYYHVISRCVRRAFLCGFDRLTKRSFEHRRQWIVDRIKHLTSIFNIDTCAYAIMSNHYHLVLKVNDNSRLSDKQVLINWGMLCSLPYLCEKYLRNGPMTNAEIKVVMKNISEYRKRLISISWFMKLLNQDIAFRANGEDNCKGHFFESRFKSQALLDERALLTAMAYVDLNPIRAAIAKTPEESDYTSIQERITKSKTVLLSFDNENLPYMLSDYLQLVDVSGRAIIEGKRGYIPADCTDILNRLNINPDTWLEELKGFKSKGYSAVGTLEQLRKFCKSVGKKFSVGLQLIPQLE